MAHPVMTRVGLAVLILRGQTRSNAYIVLELMSVPRFLGLGA